MTTFNVTLVYDVSHLEFGTPNPGIEVQRWEVDDISLLQFPADIRPEHILSVHVEQVKP